MTVGAVVVTRDREALLRECLAAVQAQTRAPDFVVVVDNASSDGTAEMLRDAFADVDVLRLERNSGSAGGFRAGMRAAMAAGCEWLWLLDDDTIARPDALERLLAGAERAPGARPLLLASRVDWTDGRTHPMNRPVVRTRWAAELGEGASRGLLLIRNATFVSTLFHRECLERFGLPQEHFFLWTDDTEYTTRVLRDAPGYLVPDSRVEHRTKTTHTAVDDTTGRFYFHVRNYLWLLRGTGLRGAERLHALRFYATTIARYLARNRTPRALGVVARGLRDGARGAVR
jgi:rhamnopyranosyl-N-acetylglucosaminyl-diphospho-decaprenol beta-1,3/1,4-galactofuranosyltransferase